MSLANPGNTKCILQSRLKCISLGASLRAASELGAAPAPVAPLWKDCRNARRKPSPALMPYTWGSCAEVIQWSASQVYQHVLKACGGQSRIKHFVRSGWQDVVKKYVATLSSSV